MPATWGPRWMMTRRRKGRPVHGWVILDKGAGRSSAWAVAQVRRIFDAAKAGHAGTLDPLATGVLPVALGEATKTVRFLQDADKAYSFMVRWGEERDTGDFEGKVTATSGVRPSPDSIRDACTRLTGEIQQVPPAFSAIKVGGRRAYELARRGDAPALPPRTVRIDRLGLTGIPDRDHATFLVECGKGTYVRSLARDLAVLLGTFGAVAAMRRERVGRMAADQAISLEKLAEVVHSAAPNEVLYPVETALDDIPALPLTEAQAQRLREGQAVQVQAAPDGAVCVMAGGNPIAIARVEDGEVRPVRVFNL